MFENDEKIERKYRNKATAYAMGIIHGGIVGVFGALIVWIVPYIIYTSFIN